MKIKNMGNLTSTTIKPTKEAKQCLKELIHSSQKKLTTIQKSFIKLMSKQSSLEVIKELCDKWERIANKLFKEHKTLKNKDISVIQTQDQKTLEKWNIDIHYQLMQGWDKRMNSVLRDAFKQASHIWDKDDILRFECLRHCVSYKIGFF